MGAHCKEFKFPLESDSLPLNNDRSAVKGKTHCKKRNLLKQSKADFSDRKSRLSEISADSNMSKLLGKDEHLNEYLLLSVEFPGG